jgi:hypothetical protein
MALTITENRRAPAGEETLRVSSRVAGGRKDVTDEPPQVRGTALSRTRGSR